MGTQVKRFCGSPWAAILLLAILFLAVFAFRPSSVHATGGQLANTAQVIAVTNVSQTFTFTSGTQTGRGCLWTQTGDAQVFIDWTGGAFATVAASTAAGADKTFLNAGDSIRIPASATTFSVKTASSTATLQYIADAKQ